MRQLVRSAVFAGTVAWLCLGGAARAAEDAAVKGAVWVGVWKQYGRPPGKPPDVSSTDVRLVVAKRQGEEIEMEFWVEDGKKGLLLKGTVAGNGKSKSVKLTTAKVLQGQWADDIVGRAQAVGSIKGEQIKWRYAIPDTYPRWGTVDAKLKKPDPI